MNCFKQTPVGKVYESMQGEKQPVKALYNPTVELLKYDAVGIKRELLKYAELLGGICECDDASCEYCADAELLQLQIDKIQSVIG